MYKRETIFSDIAQQHPERVAALFSFYGISAPANEANLINAIKVYGRPFTEKLEGALNEAEESEYSGFSILDIPAIKQFTDRLNAAKAATEQAEKDQKQVDNIKQLFYAMLIILFLIGVLIVISAFKSRGK